MKVIFSGTKKKAIKSSQDINTSYKSYDAFVMSKDSVIEPNTDYDYKEKVIGMFYIKPNYPGRSSHVRQDLFLKLYFTNTDIIYLDL